MMGRDDVAVGVGGEGGILSNGTILPNVGGYLPIIEQVSYLVSIFLQTLLFPKYEELLLTRITYISQNLLNSQTINYY